MSENIFGLTVAADKGLDDLQCQRLLRQHRTKPRVLKNREKSGIINP